MNGFKSRKGRVMWRLIQQILEMNSRKKVKDGKHRRYLKSGIGKMNSDEEIVTFVALFILV